MELVGSSCRNKIISRLGKIEGKYMNWKKVRYCLLVFIIWFSTLSQMIPVKAQNIEQIAIGSKTAIPGKLVDVPIKMNNSSDAAAIEVILNYDSQLLELKQITRGADLDKSISIYSNRSTGKVIIGGIGSEFPIGETELFIATFQVAEQVTERETVISFGEVLVADSGAKNVTNRFTASNGKINFLANNAKLESLLINNGTLSPEFTPDTQRYIAAVENSVDMIQVTATAEDSNASITVNGSPVTSGKPSTKIPLTVGQNNIPIIVTAEDGETTVTYTINVTRAASDNANLNQLNVTDVDLPFNSDTLEYSGTVEHDVTNVTVSALTADPHARMEYRLNGTNTQNDISLAVGSNVIEIIVTAENGSQKTYKVTIIRESLSENANLSQLSAENVALSPVFDNDTTSYTGDVANSVGEVNITAMAEDAKAKVQYKVNGVEAANPISLDVGSNIIEVMVTAEDQQSTKTYTVIINRAASSNSHLENLSISDGSLTPEFSSAAKNYTTKVANSVTSTIIHTVPEHSGAKVKLKLDENEVQSPIPLSVGVNKITVIVTAEDGITTSTYSVDITREGSSNADLKSLGIENLDLSPEFSAATTSYSATVDTDVESIKLHAVRDHNQASIKYLHNNQPLTDIDNIPLAVGDNVIQIIVTAEDAKTEKVYTVTVTRLAPSSNANLRELSVGNLNLFPTFSSDVEKYEGKVGHSVTTVNITASPDDNEASIQYKLGGLVVTNPISLQEGLNEIEVIVTAKDGTEKTYMIELTREASSLVKSRNANLAKIVLNDHLSIPDFAADKLEYSVLTDYTTENVVVTPTAENNKATIIVNGEEIGSGASSESISLLENETTKITFVVTAEDPTVKKTYIVHIKRLQNPSDADARLQSIALFKNDQSISYAPGFSPDATSYNVSSPVPNNVNTVIMKAAAQIDGASMSVKVNGSVVEKTTGSYSIPLRTGSNVIAITVTSKNKSEMKTYYMYVTKAKENSDEQDVQEAVNKLTVGYTEGDNWESVTSNVFLLETGLHNTSIGWTSNKPGIISVEDKGDRLEGKVIRPEKNDETVILTATVEKNGKKLERQFLVIVKNNQLTNAQTTEQPYTFNNGVRGAKKVTTTLASNNGNETKKIDKYIVDKEMLNQMAENTDGNTIDLNIPTEEDESESPDELALEVPNAALENAAAYEKSINIETSHGTVSITATSVKSMAEKGIDLYLRIVPVKDENKKQEVIERTKTGMQQVAGNGTVKVLDIPREIDTNYTGLEIDTQVLLPLKSITLPDINVEEFLQSLRVYIEHSDGTTETANNTEIVSKDGKPEWIKFTINKFSTFTIFQVERPVVSEDSSSGSSSENINVNHHAYINGFKDGTFKPESNVTRAEIVAMIARNLGYKDSQKVSSSPFPDVPTSNWAAGAIAFVKAQGLMKGDNFGNFNPNAFITRAEVVAIVARYQKLPLPSNIESAEAFTDIIGHWAMREIAAVKTVNIVNGYDDGTFRPNRNLSRAETVKVINRMFNRGPLSGVTAPSFKDVPTTHWAYKEIEEATREHQYKVDSNGAEIY